MYTPIKSNSNTIVVDMAKNSSNKNKNEIIWSEGQDKSIITDKPLYFEGEDEDTLFFEIERNKHIHHMQQVQLIKEGNFYLLYFSYIIYPP